MQITYRIPSKKVPYGYIEFQWERTDGDASLPDPAELAEEYAQYIKDYQAAEIQAFENPSARQLSKPKPADDINDVSEDDIKDAAKAIKDTLGATEIKDSDPVAPWNKPDTTESTASKPAPKAWDF